MRQSGLDRFPSLSFVLLLPAMSLAQTQQLPQHPRLLFDTSGIARLKQRAVSAQWSGQWERLRRDADRALTEKIDLPPRGRRLVSLLCLSHTRRAADYRQAHR